MSESLPVLGPLIGGLVAAAGVLLLALLAARRARRNAERQAAAIVEDARVAADQTAREASRLARERVQALEEETERLERELEQRENELEGKERRLARERAALDKQRGELDRRSEQLAERERQSREHETRARADLERAEAELERIAGMTAAQARDKIIELARQQARAEAARSAKLIEDEARETAERQAMQIVVQSMNRLPLREALETTVSYIRLPSDEMKGRIIGREGRNIRALEMATGIDLIVDDTPGAILISSFDPVRREVARVAIERLVEDGRIHPARIEEMVEKVGLELEQLVEEHGTQAALGLGISELNSRLARLVGRLKFGALHGHNLLQHSLEVALLGAYMAETVGADAMICRAAGLLHEIARVDEQSQGHPAIASAELASRFGQSEPVAAAIQSLHPDVEPTSLEAHLLAIANRLSDNRPGAHKDNLEIFVERLTRLERIVKEFAGVRRAFAVKAGKEIRVIVDPDAVSDDEAFELSKRIARRIETELSFPGQIKVNVVREVRSVHFAL